MVAAGEYLEDDVEVLHVMRRLEDPVTTGTLPVQDLEQGSEFSYVFVWS